MAGIGWERTEGTPPPPGQPAKGRVYFTYCGQRLSPYLEDVSGGMWPVVHIQKKAGCLVGKENKFSVIGMVLDHTGAETASLSTHLIWKHPRRHTRKQCVSWHPRPVKLIRKTNCHSMTGSRRLYGSKCQVHLIVSSLPEEVMFEPGLEYIFTGLNLVKLEEGMFQGKGALGRKEQFWKQERSLSEKARVRVGMGRPARAVLSASAHRYSPSARLHCCPIAGAIWFDG